MRACPWRGHGGRVQEWRGQYERDGSQRTGGGLRNGQSGRHCCGGLGVTGQEINGIIAAILLALGVAAPVPAFTGGMLLALGAAYAVRSFRGAETQKDRKSTRLNSSH